MRLLLIGCEYSGTTTLAKAIWKWGQDEMGADFGLFHDHWKIPNVTGHWPIDVDSFATEKEQKELLSISSKLKEQMQRHSLYYHIQPGAFNVGREEEQGFYSDYMAIGMHIEDAVYGPLYFGYGAEGQPAPRTLVCQTVERALLEHAPDFVLVLVKASAAVIARRMKDDPHTNQVLQEGDIERVLGRFEEEFEKSSLHTKLTIDTSSTSVEETLITFAEEIEPHLSVSDRERRDRYIQNRDRSG